MCAELASGRAHGARHALSTIDNFSNGSPWTTFRRLHLGTADAACPKSTLAPKSNWCGGSKVKLVWQCEKGHCWKAFVTPVRRGSWCPLCAGNQRLTLEHFQQLAAQHGGKCLSEEYVNKETPLWFECKAGHRWRTRPAQIRKGAWCGQCAQIARRNPYKRVKADQGQRAKGPLPMR